MNFESVWLTIRPVQRCKFENEKILESDSQLKEKIEILI